jgi:hypothetical protein
MKPLKREDSCALKRETSLDGQKTIYRLPAESIAPKRYNPQQATSSTARGVVMEKWEYLVDDEVTLKQGKERMQGQLDEQGREGWELVSIMPEPGPGSAKFLAVYKRPIKTGVQAPESTPEKTVPPVVVPSRVRKIRLDED